jgi:hypothetical protein
MWRSCNPLEHISYRSSTFTTYRTENGHSRRFVYEDRDQALTRLADAITAGLDARLDEVVRDAAGLRYSSPASSPSSTVEKSHGRANGIGTPAG